MSNKECKCEPADYPGKPWQPLFDHLVKTQNKVLTLDEMEELINVVEIMIGHRELQVKCEQLEKALNQITNVGWSLGVQGCINVANNALTPKTSTDDTE